MIILHTVCWREDRVKLWLHKFDGIDKGKYKDGVAGGDCSSLEKVTPELHPSTRTGKPSGSRWKRQKFYINEHQENKMKQPKGLKLASPGH